MLTLPQVMEIIDSFLMGASLVFFVFLITERVSSNNSSRCSVCKKKSYCTYVQGGTITPLCATHFAQHQKKAGKTGRGTPHLPLPSQRGLTESVKHHQVDENHPCTLCGGKGHPRT